MTHFNPEHQEFISLVWKIVLVPLWLPGEFQSEHVLRYPTFDQSEDHDEFQCVRRLLYAWHCFKLSYIYIYLYEHD